MNHFYDRMGLRFASLAEDIQAEAMAAYESGEMASFLQSDAIRNAIVDGAKKNIHDAPSLIVSADTGAAADLRRLKDFLGDSLPENWEQIRFERNMSACLTTAP